jgi:thiol-disulfide isomerase/thioredoxin
VPDASAPEPVVEMRAGVRFVNSRAAAARLLPDTSPPSPRQPTRLLFLEGRAAMPAGRDVLVADSAGQLFVVDKALRMRSLVLELGGRVIRSAVRDASGTLWIADAAGRIIRVDRSGALHEGPTTPFVYTTLGGDPSGSAIWAVRSPSQFDFSWTPGPAPVAVRLDDHGPRESTGTVGTATRPAHALLGSLANAGHIVAAGDTVFFAPFIRDELIAFGPGGETLWVATRGLPQSTREPRFEIDRGRAVIDYHPVNLGLARGLDGHLYVLSTPGFTMTASRIDVFDAKDGGLLRSAALATAEPTLAGDRKGRLYAVDPDLLRRGAGATPRPLAPRLQLPLLAGGDVSLEAMKGRVVLLNFWASWCAPCRREMPALDSLRRRVSDSAFAFLAVNEDQSEGAARQFVDEFGFDFPIALGRGTMDRAFAYPGLPHTVLVDAQGRVARTWIGELTPRAISDVEAAIRRELGGDPEKETAHAHEGHAND